MSSECPENLARPAIHFFVNVAHARNPIARTIFMELIRPLPRVLRMFGRGMPLKSGSSRECISETPCGVVIGRFRNANNGQQVVYHALYIDRLVGTRGPQAPAIFRRKVSHTHAISARALRGHQRRYALMNPLEYFFCWHLVLVYVDTLSTCFYICALSRCSD